MLITGNIRVNFECIHQIIKCIVQNYIVSVIFCLWLFLKFIHFGYFKAKMKLFMLYLLMLENWKLFWEMTNWNWNKCRCSSQYLRKIKKGSYLKFIHGFIKVNSLRLLQIRYVLEINIKINLFVAGIIIKIRRLH